MENPTLLMITDRNDLDDQLFGTFSSCSDLAADTLQAESREHLKELLQVPSGGVVFTTIQKFLRWRKRWQYPEQPLAGIIVVIAMKRTAVSMTSSTDSRDTCTTLYRVRPSMGLRYPIERDDRSTPAVFGDYIDNYDILRAVEDGATVPIFYEGRLSKIDLKEEEKPKRDPEFEENSEGRRVFKQKLRTKWALLKRWSARKSESRSLRKT